MRKVRRRKVLLLALVLVVGIGLWLWTNREPRYQGRALSAWCDQGIDALVAPTNASAALLGASNAVWQIGEPGAAWINPWIESVRIPRWESWLWDTSPGLMSGSEWGKSLFKRRARTLQRAFFVAHILRDRASGAIPELMSADRIHHNAWSKRTSVRLIGPVALEALFPPLSDPSSAVRNIARETLRYWGTNAVAAGPTLWSQLDANGFSGEQEDILATLAHIGHGPTEVARLLARRIEAFPSNDPMTGERWARWLSQTGDASAPHFAGFLVHTNPAIRRCVIRALLHFDHPAQGEVRLDHETAIWGMFDDKPWTRELTTSWQPTEFLRKTLTLGGSPAKENCLDVAFTDLELSAANPSHRSLIVGENAAAFIHHMTQDDDPVVAQKAREMIAKLRQLGVAVPP